MSPHRPSKKVGLAPGTLVHIGEKKTEQTRITLIQYDETSLHEKEIVSVAELPEPTGARVDWINIDGLHDTNLIKAIGEKFQIHALMLEDIVNTEQRPKVDDYGTLLFVVLKVIHTNGEMKDVQSEQISVILGKNFLLTFQERPSPLLDPLRSRIRNAIGRFRELGEDYLLYAIIDSVVDHAFLAVEILQERVDMLQSKIFSESVPQTLQELHRLRQEMVRMRKIIWPLRELCGALLKENPPLIQEKTKMYLRDLYDHAIRIADAIQFISEMLSHLHEAHHIQTSYHLNHVMRILTVITTIFMPLNFIVGVYGMNFRYMPELEWKWSYPILLGLLFFIGLGLWWFSKRKRWL